MPLRRAAPVLAAAVWLALILAGLAAAALRATEPPAWDALSYMQKAMTFWQAAAAGKPFNPFDLPMTIRPPGTILMSYPFGWTADFHWFYFRSCAIPVALLMLAVFIAGWSRDAAVRTRWMLAALALSLAGLPILYQFQYIDDSWPATWGLVDGFLAGVAALAAAAVIRSAAARSVGWATAAALLGAFCLLVKPSGLALMGLTGVAWLLIAGRNWSPRVLKENADEWRFALTSIVGAVLIFAAVTVASFTSAYFSPENIAFGQRVLTFFDTQMSASAHALRAFHFTRVTFGYVVPALLVAGLVVAARQRDHRNAALAALLCLTAGLWFWLGKTYVVQIRYFLPFATMAFVLLVPALMRWTNNLPGRLQTAVAAVAAAPALLTAVFLFTPVPPSWQKALGVNLAANAFEPENAQAEAFLHQLETEGAHRATVYMTDTTPALRNFLAVAGYPILTAPERPQVTIFTPVDWETPDATRTEDMLRADFIAFEPEHDTNTRGAILARTDVPNFKAETALFNAWLSTLTPVEGVEPVSETRVRLLRIADHALFDAALTRLEQSHRWPPGYVAANPPRWWSAADVAARLHQTELPPEILFHKEGETETALTLRGLEVETLAMGGLRLHLWIARDPAIPKEGWRLFAHLLDAQGAIIGNGEKLLATDTQPDTDTPLRHQALTFAAPPPGVAAMAFGFLRTDGAQTFFLANDNSASDWNGRRLIVPLPASR